MKDILVWGTSAYYKNRKDSLRKDYNIIGFIDNETSKQGLLFDGHLVYPPEALNNLNYDKIVIASRSVNEIINQLLDMNIHENKIDILYQMKNPYIINIEINPKDKEVIYNLNDFSFTCNLNSISDFYIIYEIFEVGCYNLNIGCKNKDVVVIDIGMNIALATLFFASKSKVKRVYSYEPFIPTYKRALKNISMNNDEIKNKITTFPFALGKREGGGNTIKECFYDEKNPGEMSIIDINTIKSSTIEKIELKDAGAELEKIFNCHKNSSIIMKVDCEGSEYDIFESLDKKGILGNADIILLEWHNGKIKELITLFEKYEYNCLTTNLIGVNSGLLYAFK